MPDVRIPRWVSFGTRLRVVLSIVAISMLHAAPGAAQTISADASSARANRGNDPFFSISQALASCPTPLGPLETEQEWLDEAHYRIERGNSCWIEGRCRLYNAYAYDTEIADTVKRRLATLATSTHWREHTTLWLMLQRRFIYVQGCVSRDFDRSAFLAGLAQTADVDKVIDQTMIVPSVTPPALPPYRTLAEPQGVPAP